MDRLAVMEQFLAVAEAGSFSAAARRLNVGQPSISKAVAQLEAYLGVRLFQRSTRSLTLTEAGRRYRDGAERAIAAAAAAATPCCPQAVGLQAPSGHRAETVEPATAGGRNYP